MNMVVLVHSEDEYFLLKDNGFAAVIEHHDIKGFFNKLFSEKDNFYWRENEKDDILKVSKEWGNIIAYWHDGNLFKTNPASVADLQTKKKIGGTKICQNKTKPKTKNKIKITLQR